jgi:hypothetical protein
MTDSYLFIDSSKAYGRVDWSTQPPDPNSKTITSFMIPTQWDQMVEYFHNNTYFLVPMNTHSTYTWNVLKRLSKIAGIAHNDETWISKILERELTTGSGAELLGWAQILNSQGWKATAKKFTQQASVNHSAKIAQNTLSLEEVRKQIEEAARASFTALAKIPGETLTSVKLQSQTAGSIMSNLGVTYDLFKMIESDTIKKQVLLFDRHIQLVTFLQQWGGPKQGLPDQEAFTDRKKLTKNQVSKLLQTPTFETPNPTKKSSKSSKVSKSTISPDELYTSGLHKLKSIFTQYPDPDVEPTIAAIEAIINSGRAKVKSKDLSTVAEGIISRILNKNDYLTAEKSAGRLEQISGGSKYSLDPWQSEMVEHIRSGRSVLVVGPTSGGKTFASMAAMDWLVNSTADVSLAYVAPTFHLALQTYANLVKSFKNVGISLVTGVINSLARNAKIWVGTPADLWSYLTATGETFTIGIFDEIHTLSETFGEGIEARITSHAIANLLVKCSRQVIALSATISDTDVTTIQEYLRSRTNIQIIETVVYRERVIPLIQYEYLGEAGVQSFTSIIAQSNTVTQRVPTEMLNTFHLVKTLERSDMLPAIIFDENEAACYDHYVAFVNWLEIQEYNAYRAWHQVYDDFEKRVLEVNSKLREAENEYYNKTSKASSLCNAASNNRDTIIEAIKTQIKTQILKPENLIIEPRIITTERHRKIYRLIRNSLSDGIKRSSDSVIHLPNEASALIGDLLDEWQRYNTLQTSWNGLNAEGLSTIPIPCERMGPYFTIGTYSLEFETFKYMRNPSSAGKSPAAMKLHRFMKGLCEAERISEADVDPLLQLIDRGLQFGVGIILPTMPFVVQYELLRLLNNKKVSLIFSSRSMSMGVNVPLRSVVIRSTEVKAWNVCELMQMSGRCGRRRLDTQGHVVFWNVLNSREADVSHLPLIAIPQMGAEQGSLIAQPLDVAIQIEINRATIKDVSAIKASLGFLNPTKGDIPLDLLMGEGDLSSSPIIDDEAKSTYTTNTGSTLSLSVDDRELSASIAACVDPIAISIGYNEIVALDLVQRIQRLAMNKILVSDKLEPYKTAEVITVIKRGIQELHTRYYRNTNLEWLSFMANTFELLHRVTYRQLRL